MEYKDWDNQRTSKEFAKRLKAYRANELSLVEERTEEYEDNYDVFTYYNGDKYSTYLAVYEGKLLWTINELVGIDEWDNIAARDFVDLYPNKLEYNTKDLEACAKAMLAVVESFKGD